jgi:hypothetical protein
MKSLERFNAFIPMEIEKSVNNKTGADEYKFKAVASDDSKDSDGEELDADGFDFQDLLSYGVVNYNHNLKSNPKSIIGHPEKARVVNKQFIVEGVLYADAPLTKDIVDVSKLLEKHGGKRHFGVSIEGIPIQRDMVNPKRIRKARITGMAVTLAPKNKNTMFSLVKGDYINLYEEPEYEIEKSENNPNGSIDPEFLIDLKDEERGLRVTMDKNLNIKVEKSLTTDSTSGKAMKKEHIDKDLKSQTFHKSIVTIAKGYESGIIGEDEKNKVVKKLSSK